MTRRRFILAVLALSIAVAPGVWVAARYHYSFHRRFARSRAQLDAYANQVMAADPSAPLTLPPGSLGAFEASDAFRLPHGFAFRCDDDGQPRDWNGLAYSTEPLPAQMPDPHPPFKVILFKPMEGNWYRVERD